MSHLFTPICSKCRYINIYSEGNCLHRDTDYPIFHSTMVCGNDANKLTDYINGDKHLRYCEEINRHGECLIYMPYDAVVSPSITFTNNLAVITNEDYGGVSYYTLDGTDPTKESSIIKGGENVSLYIDKNTTVKVFSILNEYTSPIVSLECVPSATKPTITCTSNKVTIKKSEGNAKVYYTVDGTDPTEASTLYTEAFAITATVTVKAISVVGTIKSDIVTIKCDYTA